MKEEVQTFRGHKKEASAVAWHPIHEGLFCSGGSDGSVIFWHVDQEKEVGQIEQVLFYIQELDSNRNGKDSSFFMFYGIFDFTIRFLLQTHWRVLLELTTLSRKTTISSTKSRFHQSAKMLI